jgi:transposase
MESMPAPASPITVGVDTHLEIHVAAVVDQTGRLCGTQAFPASTRGYVALVTWAEGFGPVERIGIEGTGTHGAGLARFARAYGLQVMEVDRPDRSIRRRRGKSDPIDAQAAARATLFCRAPAFSRFVPLVQSPHMTHEREATLVGQVKEPERRVNRTGHLVHFGRTPGPCL